MGFEPMYNGFAGRRVGHFATRAQKHKTHQPACLLAVGLNQVPALDAI